jgi:hypothetical protein
MARPFVIRPFGKKEDSAGPPRGAGPDALAPGMRDAVDHPFPGAG